MRMCLCERIYTHKEVHKERHEESMFPVVNDIERISSTRVVLKNN